MNTYVQYAVYILAAVVVGLIFSFGLVGMIPHQAPMQVQVTQYQPVAPPAPAMPTLAPQVVPGSAADHGSGGSSDPYAPAPAPVVVTTQPLPTITPSPTPSVGMCQPSADMTGTGGFDCAMVETVSSMLSFIQIAGLWMAVFALAFVSWRSLFRGTER